MSDNTEFSHSYFQRKNRIRIGLFAVALPQTIVILPIFLLVSKERNQAKQHF
ncbi:hypothetical protein [uncultured Apibacter sp.]|uniref:hypothetical protein n=1 Tax=uncultured Apibacter sp. TaxID=1778616 RepID=UPI0025E6278A|nr:hypothetical protein [uncultured Apibacter sp.]